MSFLLIYKILIITLVFRKNSVKYYEWEKRLPAQNIPDHSSPHGMINFTLDETAKKAQYID